MDTEFIARVEALTEEITSVSHDAMQASGDALERELSAKDLKQIGQLARLAREASSLIAWLSTTAYTRQLKTEATE